MATDKDFEEQMVATLRFEGGYVNDPNDAGGETKYGISKRAYPDIDIANLTVDEATAIYHRDYWMPLRPGALPRLVAMKLFDMSVNMGHTAAVRVLQTACNNLAKNSDLAVDGVIGPRTIAAANSFNPGPLMKFIRQAAAQHYTRIVTANPDKTEYLRGWLRRAAA